MRPLRSIVALLLALVWLPATMHCGLEAAGVLEHVDACCHPEPISGDASSSHCDADSCGIVEGGDYQPTLHLLKVPAPVTVVCFSLLIQRAAETVSASEIAVVREGESPPEVRRSWHFVVRAALPARAPSLG